MSGPGPDARVLPASDRCIAFNYPFEDVSGVRVPQMPDDASVPRSTPLFQVLSSVIERRLSDRDCVVEFSGGCDSSLVLAAATDACRRTGHDLPIPFTYRFSAYPESDESAFQEAMVRYLGLEEWVIRDESHGFDLVGPAAQASLRAFGPVWPAQLAVRTEVYRSVAPALLLTGEGGDEVLGPRRLSALRSIRIEVQRGRVGPAARAIWRTFAPVSQRARAVERGYAVTLPWLRPEAREELLGLAALESASEPLRPRSWAGHYLGIPAVQVIRHNIEAFGAWCGIEAFSPLMDPAFVVAVANKWPLRGWAERPAVLETEFHDVLPEMVRRRRSKGTLDSVFFGTDSRALSESWDGSGLPAEILPEALRRYWASTPDNEVSGTTYLALQAASAHQGPAG